MYTIDCGVPLKDDSFQSWEVTDRQIDDLAQQFNLTSTSSGTGFGYRDQQFNTKSKRNALAFQREFDSQFGVDYTQEWSAYCGIGKVTTLRNLLWKLDSITTTYQNSPVNLKNKINKMVNYFVTYLINRLDTGV